MVTYFSFLQCHRFMLKYYCGRRCKVFYSSRNIYLTIHFTLTMKLEIAEDPTWVRVTFEPEIFNHQVCLQWINGFDLISLFWSHRVRIGLIIRGLNYLILVVEPSFLASLREFLKFGYCTQAWNQTTRPDSPFTLLAWFKAPKRKSNPFSFSHCCTTMRRHLSTRSIALPRHRWPEILE